VAEQPEDSPVSKVEEKKKTVLLSFDDELLIDARKVLFKHNMTLQQYFTFVIHKLVLEDLSAKDLLGRAVKFHEESLESEEKEKVLKINTNNLYSLFERQDQEEEK
jgi:hypothetical protein